MQAAELRFDSRFWANLHHTLYAAAWDDRRSGGGIHRVLAGALPASLDADLSSGEADAWNAAIAYYDATLASKHLLFGPGMRALGAALAAGDSTTTPSRRISGWCSRP
jgi:hypothetical protein